MVLANYIVNGVFALYILFGSYSWGYILLRIGWPNIRSLEIEYKKGWSIIFGLIFSALILGSSMLLDFLKITQMPIMQLLMITTIIFFIVGALLFTVKRKLLGARKVNVAVPKRAISANIVAKKAVKKIPKTDYVPQPTDRRARLTHLKEKLETMKQEEKAKPAMMPQFRPSAIQMPVQGMARQQPAKMPSEESKKLDEIINSLEERESQKRTTIVTRHETQQKAEASDKYIRQNLKEKISLEEEESEPSKLEKDMPRSAKLLKELLKETGGNNE